MVILAVSLYMLLQVVDVSAQSCTITPLNPTTLTANGGALLSGTTDVRIQCVCPVTNDDQRVRWYDINGYFVNRDVHADYVTGTPYYILNSPNGATVVTLVIPTFNDSYDGTYNCGIRYSNTEFTSPSAAVTLTIACAITPLFPTNGLTAAGGVVVSGTTNVRIQCICTVTGNLRWYDINTNFLVQSTHPTNYVAGSPYFILGATIKNVQNVTLVIPTFNDSYDGTYNCGIFVTNTEFTSPSAAVTLTIGGVEPPTNVRTTVLTPRSVEVKWDPSSSSDVTGYLISYTTTASYTSGGSVTVIGHSTTSGNLENLEEGTHYTITVQATTDDDRRGVGVTVEVTTYTDVPSSPPMNVMVTSVFPASLKVSWKRPPNIDRNGPLTGYVLEYTSQSGDMMSENATGISHTISGLVAYVNYSVMVATVNVNGTGPFSNPVVGRSGEDVPSAPDELGIFTINSSSVTLQWIPPDPSNGVITQYSIQLNGTDITNLSSNVLMYTIGGLSPDTVYALQLTASTSAGAGPPITTAVITAAGSISVVTVSDGSVTSIGLALNWTKISLTNSDLSHYTVFFLPLRGPYDPVMTSNRRKRQSVQTGELTMNFTGTTGTLTNLYGAVTYRIQVAAVSTFNGQYLTGDRSPATEITTLEGVPTAPRNFNYINSTDTGVMFNITLTWSRPDPPNGIITQYNVSYIVTNSQGEIVYDFTIQTADINSNVHSSHTWINLIQGRYNFSVVASSNTGPGEAASLMLDYLPKASSDSSSDDNAGVIIALAILFAIAVIGLAITVVIIVILAVKLKQLRYDVNESNIRYSEIKQSMSRDNNITDSNNTITDSKHVQSTEVEYEAIETDPKPNMKPTCDVKMDANPAYQATY